MSLIREAHDMLATARAWHQDGQLVALLTLVRVKGSAYRRPGAKMVMAHNGKMKGSLSGGCLEGDLFLHAERAMERDMPSLHHYDLTEDEMWGLGIGCKGEVDVWIEPIKFDEEFWQKFYEAVASHVPVIWGGELPQGIRYFAPQGEPWTIRGSGTVSFRWEDAAQGGSTGLADDVWWDVMRPPERLVIAGAGHDARPVARLAQQVGFDVVVLDPREHVNNDENFPGVEHWVKGAEELAPSDLSEAFWVVMNHHQKRDEASLALAAKSRPRYLGVLGPRVRTQEMLANIAADEAALPLRSPVGLDIGAESPDAVAVSIVGELMAARVRADGGPLDGKDRIHR